ncbi:unnamed protein product [Amoebophrya sp. A25]|nr:unnamed protein product [Amoebophrya sp. A25]|eukprot:GSA25T00022825001.1
MHQHEHSAIEIRGTTGATNRGNNSLTQLDEDARLLKAVSSNTLGSSGIDEPFPSLSDEDDVMSEENSDALPRPASYGPRVAGLYSHRLEDGPRDREGDELPGDREQSEEEEDYPHHDCNYDNYNEDYEQSETSGCEAEYSFGGRSSERSGVASGFSLLECDSHNGGGGLLSNDDTI